MPKKESSSAPDHHEVKTLLSWKALSRPYKKRKREFYLMLVFLTLCVSIAIYILLKDFMLILASFSIAFLAIVLYTIKPREVEHKITTQAVITGEHAYLYKELYDFWFEEKDGNTILHLHTYVLFPGVLSLLLGEGANEKKIRDVLVKYIPYREVMAKTFMDKAGNWLSKNFPLESSKS